MRTFLPLLALVAVVAAAGGAQAAKGDTKSDPTPMQVQLARLMLPQKQWDEMITTVQQSQRPLLQQIAGNDPEKLQKAQARFDSAVSDLMSYDEVMQLQAKALEANYTKPEMTKLIAFYRSDVGKKSLEVNPKVMEQSLGTMQQRLGSQLGKVLQELQAELQPQGAPTQPGLPTGQ